MLPVWMQQAAEERRLRDSDAEFERVISMGVGPMDTGTEEQEVSSYSADAGCGEACTMLGGLPRSAFGEAATAVLGSGLQPSDALFAAVVVPQFLRSAAEWRRWEGVGCEPWREHKREAWAEELLQSQHRRRVEREQLRCKEPSLWLGVLLLMRRF